MVAVMVASSERMLATNLADAWEGVMAALRVAGRDALRAAVRVAVRAAWTVGLKAEEAAV